MNSRELIYWHDVLNPGNMLEEQTSDALITKKSNDVRR